MATFSNLYDKSGSNFACCGGCTLSQYEDAYNGEFTTGSLVPSADNDQQPACLVTFPYDPALKEQVGERRIGPSWGMAVPTASAAAATSSPSAAPSPRSPPPPAPAAVPAAMVNAPAGAVTPLSPVRSSIAPSSPVRAPVVSSSPVWAPVALLSPVRAPVAPFPSDAAAEAPGSSLVPPRSSTSPVGSSSATPHDASASLPPTVLQQLIYEVTFEGLCGDDVGGYAAADDASDDSVAAEDVPLQEVGLFSDGDEEDTQRTKRARLRRGDETSDRHPFLLPKAPERHPTTNHRNHYNPDAPWDYAISAGITRLLDVEGESPHRCYLVQWKGRPMQMAMR
ncbi:uncharacterized protein PITG_16394 [Phytophthora infestans T30-4]|uniref:Chromo domain-containing protein n=1 Tax=Phytophthora infestans (strain T30-4) TaxID=403677 RepID=D0NU65_PHYIT|nr:uncharacterized protein PITG_16394 [Phytophthora infestans T30-4]EEY65189.1 conserved hypothetical protein [Phytophthora infestans T30-4]|eukprot:XP_002897446.1 conserved hypothetical protein [Phytophthora infestans T30-4]